MSAPARMRKVVVSGMIGNCLEWYDYALYAQMSFILSELFFPGTDESLKLLATFGVFAVGFVFRPLGAVLFGYIGDRYGRRVSLVLAILMMAIPTGCIGLLPTYAEIGIWAPILLTLIRVFQGLSLGGEFSGSITYVVEHSPAHRRGIAGASSLISLILGFLLGSFVALLFVKLLPDDQFRDWGWRVPFLLGIVIGLVGLYIRQECEESPAYESARAEGHLSKQPLREVLRHHRKPMFQAFAFYVSVTMPFYMLSVYLLSFTQKKLGLHVTDALVINTSAMIIMLIFTALGALASDRYGRKKVMVTGLTAMVLTILPLFLWMGTASFINVLLAQIIFAAIIGFYMSPVPAVLVELFPTSVRSTGMAVSYNLAGAAFGGTAPIMSEWLIGATGSFLSLAVYVMLCNILTFAALYTFHDRFREPLRQM